MKRTKFTIMAAVLAVAGATGVARAADVENPVYKAWAKFKPGSTATYKIDTDSPMGPMSMTMTAKLDSVADEKVVLSREVMLMGNTHNAGTEDVSAKVADDKKFPESTGTEDIKVGDKTYTCKKYTMKGAPPGMPAKNSKGMEGAESTVWISDEVPGGVVRVKSEQTVNGKAMKSDMTLTAVDAK